MNSDELYAPLMNSMQSNKSFRRIKVLSSIAISIIFIVEARVNIMQHI